MKCLSNELSKFAEDVRFDILLKALKVWVGARNQIDYNIYNEIKEWIELAWNTDEKRFHEALTEILRLHYLLPVFVNIAAALKKWKDIGTSVQSSAESCQDKIRDALLQMIDGHTTTDQIVKLWQSTEDSHTA